MSLEDRARDIIKDLNVLEDWMDKYEYLIGLARKLPPMNAENKNDEWQIKGCQSVVWIKTVFKNGRLYFEADSDAMITKGLAALLITICDGATPREILDGDFSFLSETGIQANLSPSRSNGLASMVARIRERAMLYAAG